MAARVGRALDVLGGIVAGIPIADLRFSLIHAYLWPSARGALRVGAAAEWAALDTNPIAAPQDLRSTQTQ